MANLLKVFIAIHLVIASYLGLARASTPIRKCESERPLPLMVQIEGCSELPCNIWKGKISNMAIQFVATRNSMMNIRASLKLTTLGAEIPFELIEERSDVCRNLMYGAYCPLDAGEDVTYHLMLSIGDNQPELPVKIEISLMDKSNEETFSCFVTDGRIRKPLFSHN